MYPLIAPSRSAADRSLRFELDRRLQAQHEWDPWTGCLVWIGAWQWTGAGVIQVNGRKLLVARVAAWVYLGGFDLWDMSIRVRHAAEICTTPACFAPRHLQRIVRRLEVGPPPLLSSHVHAA